MSRKAKKQRSKNRPPQRVWSISAGLQEGLEQVERLTRRRKWAEALTELQRLDQRYPNHPAVLTELVNVCYELKDMRFYLRYIRALVNVNPSDPETQFGLAGAYLTNIYPAKALQLYRQWLKRYPNHELAPKAKEALALVEKEMDNLLADVGVSGEEGLELAAQHDEVRAHLEMGDYPQGRVAARRLLQRYPDFIPALNNLGQIDFMEGHSDQAIASARRVLELEPDNFQALGNLARYLFLTGQADEARQWAERLKTIESKFSDIWIKKAETLSYLGDDQAVLDVFKAAVDVLETDSNQAFLYHLAAAAALRLGHEKQAQQYWEKTLKFSPGFHLAQANLSDLKKPVSERHAPWAFDLPYWLSQQAIQDMTKLTEATLERKSENSQQQAIRRYLEHHPVIINLAPILLARGDASARELVMLLATLTEHPDLLAALRDFALSQNGPDELRLRALNMAAQAGLLPAKQTRLWLNGQWTEEIIPLSFEIYTEPKNDDNLPVRVLTWLAKGIDALHDMQPKQAEEFFQRALAIAPDSPPLLNNLALAYVMQRRYTEAETLARQIYRQHPNYFFGRIGMANLFVKEGHLQQAEDMLIPMLTEYKRLHMTEFEALCTALINLYLAKNMLEAARRWADMWASVNPDSPELANWRQRITLRGLKPGWLQRMGL